MALILPAATYAGSHAWFAEAFEAVVKPYGRPASGRSWILLGGQGVRAFCGLAPRCSLELQRNFAP